MTEKNYQSMNPTELLREQVQLLADLNRNLEELIHQQEKNTEVITVAAKKVLQQMQTPPTKQSQIDTNQLSVTITDIPMTISKMANFMVKWAIAAIPAAIALAVLGTLVMISLAIFGLR